MKFKHESVMPDEVIDALKINPSGIYVDCTLGGGGHSLRIGRRLNEDGLLIGIDRDIDAITAAGENLRGLNCKVEIVHENFSELGKILDGLQVDKVDGIIFDLGVSSYQIDTAERGFSYMHDAPLDMRMDRTKNFSAYDVVNNYDEEDLKKIFREYGEEKFSGRIARKIVDVRKNSPIKTTGELVKLVESVTPKISSGGHPAKRIFQAIRIEVNDELKILRDSVATAVNRLKVGGRIAVITFHSLEDRIVKNTFADMARDCICPKNFPVCVCNHCAEIKILGKAKVAMPDEVEKNSRAKSAKLRAAEKIL
ncbi:MAG: 16S rRNA (cytosine(1402)-N(4))-methyltransferase RsmH [Selenomonadaceae bacterium]|nr:16S rRNA (cytosine(1402)-N(4))-methyltransferase RsmH [Selenomonadaceae bacterium]